MSNALETLLVQTERLKLSSLLRVPTSELTHLDALTSQNLRQLRERITASLYAESAAMFERVAKASKLLPISLIAKLSEKVFGSVLSARIAGYMQPDRAVDVTCALQIPFLAEVSKVMEPQRAQAVLQLIPTEVVIKVSRELVSQREFLIMARFVDSISLANILAVVDNVLDDQQLLRVASYVEHAQRLEEITERMSDDRLKRIIEVAALGNEELQLAGLLLIGQVTDQLKSRIGNLAVELGESVLLQLIRNGQQHQASGVIADVVGKMSEDATAQTTRLAKQSPALEQALTELLGANG